MLLKTFLCFWNQQTILSCKIVWKNQSGGYMVLCVQRTAEMALRDLSAHPCDKCTPYLQEDFLSYRVLLPHHLAPQTSLARFMTILETKKQALNLGWRTVEQWQPNLFKIVEIIRDALDKMNAQPPKP